MSATAATTTKPEPVLVWMSVLAGLQIFFAGSAATTVMVEGNEQLTAIFAFGALAVGAAQAGVQFYVRGQVTPNAQVVERVDGATVIAGPANDVKPEGAKVRNLGEDPAQVLGVATLDQQATVQPVEIVVRAEAPTVEQRWPQTDEGDEG